ncbi:MAG: GEVED domain-containing protein [Candidatus Nanosalina sp.]
MNRGLQLVLALSFVAALFFVAPSPAKAFGGDGNVTIDYDEECTDTVDNDGDGTVNEGCPELCDDSIDNDQDGAINEGCFGPTCFNGADDNAWDGTDTSDLACVKPIGSKVNNYEVKDDVEGNIWDTDLSQTMGDLTVSGGITEGIMFQGHLFRGSSTKTMDKQDSGTDSMTVYYADRAASEPGNWSYGLKKSKSFSESDFSFGDAIKGGKVIYHPSPLKGSGEGPASSFGDALENEDSTAGDGVKGPGSPDSDTGETTTVRSDYGRVYEKYDIYEPAKSDDLACKDDTASASSSCSGASASCGSCNGDSCSCTTSVSTDRSCQNSDYYYTINGDKIIKNKCTEDSAPAAEDDSTKQTCSGSGGCDYSCGPYGNQACKTDYSLSSQNYNCEAGDTRSWKNKGSVVNCNTYNVVDGGSTDGSGDRNDEAATYTDFTAYIDSEWGTTSFSCQTGDGKAWCAYDYTTTVDADGPKGYGDGLVAIENRGSTNSIVGTLAHNGNNEVGKRIFVDGSYKSAQGKIDLTCPGNKEVCLKYVDYWTKASGWSTTSSDGGWSDAVRVDTVHTFTPDDSYSVCKMVNRIGGQQWVNCDYERNGNPISPLNESCGDDPGERLLAMEGTEVNDAEVSNYLAHQQECFDYGSDANAAGGGGGLDSDVDAGLYADGGPSSGSSKLNDDWIRNVEFKNIDYSSSGDFSDGYQDFTGDTKTTVRRGKDVRIYVTIGMSASYPQHAKVWFDWDGDGSITDQSGTEIGKCSSDGCTVTAEVNVPSTADTGYTLMRVGERYDTWPPAQETASWDYGEHEDYSVRVRKQTSNTDPFTEDACVLNGVVYPEGSVERVQDIDFQGYERGGDSNDYEVCVNIGDGTADTLVADTPLPQRPDYSATNDNGAEWWDMDNWKVTKYLRNHQVDSQEYKNYFRNNPDDNASTTTGVKSKYKKKGFALEDDCYATINNPSIECEDIGGGTGRQVPVVGNFTEGSWDDDFSFFKGWLDINKVVVHNRVQSGGNTGHGSGPISQKSMSVDTYSEWQTGTFYETEADGTYVNTSETRGSRDYNGQLGGVDIFGKYVSRTFDKSPEKYYTNMTVYHQISGGDHPLVVQYADDSSFTTNVDSEVFMLHSERVRQEFSLSAEESQDYLRFKYGVSYAKIPSQVVFVVDETGSMGNIQNQIQNEAKDFMDSLGSGSEGAVIGFRDKSYSGYGSDGAKVYQTFTKDSTKVKNAIDNLAAIGGSEWGENAIKDAMTELNWDPNKNHALIYVQEGQILEGCHQLEAREPELNNKDITFYGMYDYTGCDSKVGELATATGGQTWGTPGDWNEILSNVRSDLRVLPKNPIVDRVTISALTPSEAGVGNTQDEEPSDLAIPGDPEYLKWSENAEIDPEDDEWAMTPTLRWGIANNGTAWSPGQCWGSPRVQGVDKWKNESTYANSYLRATNDVWSQSYSYDKIDGNWINPDNDTLSARKGGLTCDLTGKDWGYSVENWTYGGVSCLQGDCDANGNPSSSGTEGVKSGIPHVILVKQSDFNFDDQSDPGAYNQMDLNQWPKACGDDRNEYLIREHAASVGGEHNPVFSGRSNYYACADRPTDCVLAGKVYSQGQLVDISDITGESGVESGDEEICLDVDKDLPGGEWWDPDNESLRDDLIGSGTELDPEIYVREGEIEPSKPGKVFWHNGTRPGAHEAQVTPYNEAPFDTGYALEDDCEKSLTIPNEECDDTGPEESLGTDEDRNMDWYSGLIYSPFREQKSGQVVKSDDHSAQTTFPVKTYVAGSHAHGSNNGQDQENTAGVDFNSSHWGWPTENVNDSEINNLEDTWAIASDPFDAVGPTGGVYDPGKCYGANPSQYAESWVLKNETVMANSYALRHDVNNDPRDEGDWVDPDTTIRTVSNGTTSCDLNSTDWGIGFDNGTGTPLNAFEGDHESVGYEVTDQHAVAGPITFDEASDPAGTTQNNLQQYPSACGDDQNEFLIREHRTVRGMEFTPNLSRSNIYVCADRITDCAYNGSVYSEGQIVDLSSVSPASSDPEEGDQISDEEICLDLNKTIPGGEWHDKDENLTTSGNILNMSNTFKVNEFTGSGTCSYDISGTVFRTGEQGSGAVMVGGFSQTVGGDNMYSFNSISLPCGSKFRIQYVEYSVVQAEKRIDFPSSDADLDRIDLSEELMYQPVEVLNRVINWKDHDFDHNPATDWVAPDQRYKREELSFFNRSGRFNSTGPKPLTSSYVNWDAGVPDEGYSSQEEDCGEMLNGGEWNDIPCDDAHSGLCEYDDGSYATTVPMKWGVANRTCYMQGGHLAVIDSATEKNYIASNFGNVWIGYYQPSGTSEPNSGWRWVNRSGRYSPAAYATEDDCGELMRQTGTGPCGDVGPDKQNHSWFSAGNFSLGSP